MDETAPVYLKEMASRLVDVDGTLRTNIKIFDRRTHSMTEYNESGNPVLDHAVKEFIAQFRFRLSQLRLQELLVLDESVPLGVPADFCQQMILMAKEFHVRTVLDASGALLREGLKARSLRHQTESELVGERCRASADHSAEDLRRRARYFGQRHRLCMRFHGWGRLCIGIRKGLLVRPGLAWASGKRIAGGG